MHIAVIGMAGRFPGAANLDEFWNLQEKGVEAISFFNNEELIAAGVSEDVIANPSYVKAAAILDNVEMFDAEFFGFTPRQSEIADPQQRLFLECVWEALENAGYDPSRLSPRVGVFAGSSMSSYLVNLYSNPDVIKRVGGFQVMLGNDKDFLTTLVCYKLNLTGPGVTIQTACSTSLVAIHVACQQLLAGECSMALAGGVSIRLPQKSPYLYQEGGVHSPDGHCRPFDARAQGTVAGNGAGVVLLKRLEDARRDGDNVRAVICGSAINNDGADKAGFTAPSYAGQIRVIRDAHAVAGITPGDVSYIEAHGTGTILGDQIELSALHAVFDQEVSIKRPFCALGSVKANTGHLDAAAGVASLIRTVLALEKRRIPPCVHFQTPNSILSAASGPFFVPSLAIDWNATAGPRRAGVSSFGIGGTNAHVVLEEPRPLSTTGRSRHSHALMISARTSFALDDATARLAQHLAATDQAIADIAFTLHTGRSVFGHCRTVVADTTGEAATALRQLDPTRVYTRERASSKPYVAFLFPGGGTQYPGMAKQLYRDEPMFRKEMDRCFEIVRPLLHFDLAECIWPNGSGDGQLASTSRALPALFAVEYAVAKLWTHWGVVPDAVLGHSLGEYVAACIAGIMSLEEALSLVVTRGALLDDLSDYRLLSVPLSETEIRSRIPADLSINVINAPSACLVAGPENSIIEFDSSLRAAGVDCTILNIRSATHCNAVDKVLPRFAIAADAIRRVLPLVACLSNVTGDWIGESEITDKSYWSRHLREPVRFADCMDRLLEKRNLVLLEVGPGTTLGSLAKLQRSYNPSHLIVSSLPHARSTETAGRVVATAIGRLWAGGVPVNWEAYYAGESRRRVPLPTYPFQRSRCWIEQHRGTPDPEDRGAARVDNLSQWFYVPCWKRSWNPSEFASATSTWLVFADDCGAWECASAQLAQFGKIVTVRVGREFKKTGPCDYRLNPYELDGYHQLMHALREDNFEPTVTAHFWCLHSSDHDMPKQSEQFSRWFGYFSVSAIAREMARAYPRGHRRLIAFTAGAQEVTGNDLLNPDQALVTGLCRVIPQEYPNISCTCIDLDGRSAFSPVTCFSDIVGDPSIRSLSYRGGYRWIQTFEPVSLPVGPTQLRHGGVYLITGGLGRIGLAIANHLAQKVNARIAIVGRRRWPPASPELFAPGEIENIADALNLIKNTSAQIMTLSADVGSFTEMQSTVDDIYARFGPIHGVFHAPSVARQTSLMPIDSETPQDAEAHFRGKVDGTKVLARLFEGVQLDFCILFSSLSSVLGGLGLASYAAANAFEDSFAAFQRARSKTRWTSVGWEGWNFRSAGQSVMRAHGQGAAFSVSPEQGLAAFDRILTSVVPPLIAVSTADLTQRISSSSTHRFTPDQPPPHSAQPVSIEVATFEPLQSEIEERIAATWRDLLGITQLSPEHNFFELGGTSLLATYCAARLSNELGTHVPLKLLFQAPKLRDLGRLVAEHCETAAAALEAK